MNRYRAVLLTAIGLSMSGIASADTVAKLHRFLSDTQTLRAEFTQTVIARNGRQPQISSGVMTFFRPGKFRWQIEKPYPQLLVGDGQQVWIHDPELRQVTVRKAGKAIGGTPAALLAGDSTIEKNFTLRDAGEERGVDWVEAIPKAQDTGFEKVRLGFVANDLKAMELLDSLGQTTSLLFARIERNPKLAPSLFRFTPPPRTDVISE
ncbi:MAG TPA: outer membrane lipoprotein chaperone LolA [Accumulibacter sp.]|nr:outer membrane lipoprotein chaperone LolA [Accumulibacter sp.]HMW17952.1 outer membrane lipoprotein chaperone LolA [Accumulibacter sp.]HMX23281.1 outer membrane lipoprotein chaperone LolA [Accumulibacter sp.]HMY05518.1 outer membrane lipoprotein chaperone LolA [Accumulibacter sp.]HNC18897.1 outer membrane lipoprotein chaperone LolA [Accumulibacter sp.]